MIDNTASLTVTVYFCLNVRMYRKSVVNEVCTVYQLFKKKNKNKKQKKPKNKKQKTTKTKKPHIPQGRGGPQNTKF